VQLYYTHKTLTPNYCTTVFVS